MNRKNRMFFFLLMTFVFCFLVVFSVSGENTFEIKRVGNIHPYADNAFRINTDEAGELEIRIHDGICIYRTISERISAGESTIHWDGCGYNQERLYEKSYTITAELKTESGKVYTVSFASPIEYSSQYLQYVLPSSYNLYLDNQEDWFLEFRTVSKGTVIMELTPSDDIGTAFSYVIPTPAGKIARKDFKTISGKKKPVAGNYSVTVYEQSKPDVQYTFSLTVDEKTPEPLQVTVTGEIMPDRMMTDTEIWEMMMKPSVVVDIDPFKHQEVYSEPDSTSISLGTLHGQTQGLKVIQIEDGWALVGAWNHEQADYIEGWVPLSKLKVELPRSEYGILIDKQKQTLTVYQEGKKLDTLLVSTGLATKGALYQETSAGCFLTGYHRVNFSMNGKKYDYVIQYDGGNLLHQTPYDWGQQKKDFTMGRGYLGAKASHACIRIQPEPGDGGINAYWLFTHIPYHTRVIILDDKWEREARAEKLKRSDKDDLDLSCLHINGIKQNDGGDNVIITFTGCLTPGGTRSFNSRSESFFSFMEKEGYGKPLCRLNGLFSSDDLTCVNLGCMILREKDSPPEGKGVLYGPAGMQTVFSEASVELAVLTGNSTSINDTSVQATAEAMAPFTTLLNRDGFCLVTLRGHLFGFTICTEKEYLADPEVVDRRIDMLNSAGCERKIILFSWGEEGEGNHSIVQEAMAHRSVRAGADLVIGCLPGTVQGVDFIEDVPVFYSLGDLLNGSTTGKPKIQQGLVVQASFCFNLDNEDVYTTVIPLMPYGNSQKERNDFVPVTEITAEETLSSLRNLWRDSTDAALDRISFSISDQ